MSQRNADRFTKQMANMLDWVSDGAPPEGEPQEQYMPASILASMIDDDVDEENTDEGLIAPDVGEDAQRDIDLARRQQQLLWQAATKKTRLPNFRRTENYPMGLDWMKDVADHNEHIPSDETREVQWKKNLERTHGKEGVFFEIQKPKGSTAWSSRKDLYMSVLRHHAKEHKDKKDKNNNYRPSENEREALRQLNDIVQYEQAQTSKRKSNDEANDRTQKMLRRMGVENEFGRDHCGISPAPVAAGVCHGGRIDKSLVSTNHRVAPDMDWFKTVSQGNIAVDNATADLAEHVKNLPKPSSGNSRVITENAETQAYCDTMARLKAAGVVHKDVTDKMDSLIAKATLDMIKHATSKENIENEKQN